MNSSDHNFTHYTTKLVAYGACRASRDGHVATCCVERAAQHLRHSTHDFYVYIKMHGLDSESSCDATSGIWTYQSPYNRSSQSSVLRYDPQSTEKRICAAIRFTNTTNNQQTRRCLSVSNICMMLRLHKSRSQPAAIFTAEIYCCHLPHMCQLLLLASSS